jgi:hypothetical protein
LASQSTPPETSGYSTSSRALSTLARLDCVLPGQYDSRGAHTVPEASAGIHEPAVFHLVALPEGTESAFDARVLEFEFLSAALRPSLSKVEGRYRTNTWDIGQLDWLIMAEKFTVGYVSPGCVPAFVAQLG